MVLSAVLCYSVVTVDASVIGIDLGAAWSKTASVQRGKGVQIVLTEATKRKAPVVVAFEREERLFGESGMAKPHLAITGMRQLLGKKFNECRLGRPRDGDCSQRVVCACASH